MINYIDWNEEKEGGNKARIGGGGRLLTVGSLAMFSQLLQLCTLHSAQLKSTGCTVHMGKTTQEGERPFLRGFFVDFNGSS